MAPAVCYTLGQRTEQHSHGWQQSILEGRLHLAGYARVVGTAVDCTPAAPAAQLPHIVLPHIHDFPRSEETH